MPVVPKTSKINEEDNWPKKDVPWGFSSFARDDTSSNVARATCELMTELGESHQLLGFLCDTHIRVELVQPQCLNSDPSRRGRWGVCRIPA